MSATGIPAASGAESQGPAADLRRHHVELGQRSTSALLELYALETRLEQARAAAADALRLHRELEDEQRQVAERLRRVQRDAAAAEALLADRLRTLYERADVHPLAVVLGAASLDDALTQLDGLRYLAEADRRMVVETRAARQALQQVRRDLEERRMEAAAAAAAAVARAEAAQRARADAAASVKRLAAERRLTEARLATLERHALAARLQAEALAPPAATEGTTESAAAPAVPAETAPPLPAASSVAVGRTLTVVATGYALPGRTATGLPVGPGVVAVDPAVIPLGTRMTVPGYGDGIAADVGGSIKGNRIDLWFPTRAEALRWGRRTVTITLP